MALPERPDRARDHLANERTFLAWVRTGIAMVVFGFALGRFGIALRQFLQLEGKPTKTTGWSVWFGMVCIAVGVVFVFAAQARYRQTRRQIEEGAFQPAGFTIDMVAFLVAVLGLGLAGYLILTLSRVG
ncbi:MAG TPA: DUF202 domain-containing protein [Terriglobia bacterium]